METPLTPSPTPVIEPMTTPSPQSISAHPPSPSSGSTTPLPPTYIFNLQTVLTARIPTSKYIRNPLRVPLNALYYKAFCAFNTSSTPESRLESLLHLISIPKCVLREPIPRKEARRSSKTVTRDIHSRIDRAMHDDWEALFSEAVHGFDRNLPLSPCSTPGQSPDNKPGPQPTIRPLQPALSVDPKLQPRPETVTEADIRRTVRRLNSSSPPGSDGLRTAHLKALLLCPGMRQQPCNAVTQLAIFVKLYASGALLADKLPDSVGDLFCLVGHCRDHLGCALPILHLACCSRALSKNGEGGPPAEPNTEEGDANEGNTVEEGEVVEDCNVKGEEDLLEGKTEDEVQKEVKEEET